VLEFAERLHSDSAFRCADARHLPFTDSFFTAVVAHFLFLRLSDHRGAVAGITRGLAEDGWLALCN
jgi:ubiquinone/menaquinone biosynthesis C-methylase UbiE